MHNKAQTVFISSFILSKTISLGFTQRSFLIESNLLHVYNPGMMVKTLNNQYQTELHYRRQAVMDVLPQDQALWELETHQLVVMLPVTPQTISFRQKKIVQLVLQMHCESHTSTVRKHVTYIVRQCMANSPAPGMSIETAAVCRVATLLFPENSRTSRGVNLFFQNT